MRDVIETHLGFDGGYAVYEQRPRVWHGVGPAPVTVVRRPIQTEGVDALARMKSGLLPSPTPKQVQRWLGVLK